MQITTFNSCNFTLTTKHFKLQHLLFLLHKYNGVSRSLFIVSSLLQFYSIKGENVFLETEFILPIFPTDNTNDIACVAYKNELSSSAITKNNRGKKSLAFLRD